MKKPQVGQEDKPLTGKERLLLPRTVDSRPLPLTIILNLIDDNLNGRAAYQRSSSIIMYIEFPIPELR